MVRRSRRHTKQHSGIWSQRLSSVLSLPTIPSSALPGCTSPRFRTRASVLNLLSHLCAAYRVGSIVKCFSVSVKMNVHMKTKRWDMMINGAIEAVNTRHQLLNQHHRWNLWLEHYVNYYVFEHVKKKKKKNLLVSVAFWEGCFWWFCPPWVTYWHLTRTSLSPPDADAMSLEGMQPFLNPTAQTFCLNIRAIAQRDVVCVAKEFPGGVDWWVSSSWLQNYASLEPQKPANLRWRQGLHPEHVARPTQHWGTNKHRSHLQKTLCCQSASMSMSQGSWSFARGLTQTQGIGNIDHIDKASFLPLDNMNNSSANHQWSVHVSLL